MRIIFMGTPDFSVPALNTLVETGHEVAAVYTQPPRPAGRGKKDRLTPVHARAEELGIEVRHPTSLKSKEELSAFAALNAEVAVAVAYGLILPQAILDAPKHGCLNIHASLLPRWRGAAPIHRAIMAGDTKTGVCIMQMEAGLDTGPVLMREATKIEKTETVGDLHDRLSDIGSRLIALAMDNVEDLPRRVQPQEGITYAHKIDKSEARVDWSKPAGEVDRLIRGLSPFPGAWCEVKGERLKLLRSNLTSGSAEAGTHLGGFRVACGDGAVEITQAQRQGKRAMTAEEILRGMTLPDMIS